MKKMAINIINGESNGKWRLFNENTMWLAAICNESYQCVGIIVIWQ